MRSSAINVFPIWLVIAAVNTSGLNAQQIAQTVELRSAHLRVLEGDERERFLAAHNLARRAVEVAPVTWSDDLGKYALESLEQQKEALIGAAQEGWTRRQVALPRHRAGGKYGENVAAWAGSRAKTAEWAVELWLREKAAFDQLNAIAPYRVGDEAGKSELDSTGRERSLVVNHYTAIVWRGTKQIGAAKLDFELVDAQGNVRHYAAIICNYSPPGNRRGEKPY